MKITLKDFQSIENASLEFPTGVTLIQGPSASGKTAILRAIKACINNPNGTSHYIRHGAKSAQVEISVGDETLTWERTKSTTNYYYKDHEFLKASKSQSSDYCNLGVAYNHRGEILNLSDEWSLLFPFYESDTEMFKLFETVFGLGNTAEVINTCKGDETAIKKDIFDIEGKIDHLKKKKGTFEKLIGIVEKSPSSTVNKVLSSEYKKLDRMARDFIEAYDLVRYNRTKLDLYQTEDFTEAVDELTALYKDLEFAKNAEKLVGLNFSTYSNEELEENRAQLDALKKDIAVCINLGLEIEREEEVIKDCQSKSEEAKKTLAEIKTCPLCGSHLENGIIGE